MFCTYYISKQIQICLFCLKSHFTHKLQHYTITPEGQYHHCLLLQSSLPTKFCSIVSLLSSSHCCFPLFRISLLISFKLFRHSAMFLLSVQTSKELEPQCDDQIPLDYLSFQSHYSWGAWVAELQCVQAGRGWGRGASPAEAGLFHWTMRPFLLAFPGHVHNQMV